MSRHTLSIDDLNDFESSTQIAGSFGNGINKSLSIYSRLTPNEFIKNEFILSEFVVKDHNKIVLITFSLSKAVEKYNSI